MTNNTLFGISNCDSVKKARKWLEQAGIEFDFHDFRKDGVNQERLQHWVDTVGVSTLVNKRSTTWKQLNENQRAQALSTEAVALLIKHPTLIKRPVLQRDERILVGFKEDEYRSLFE